MGVAGLGYWGPNLARNFAALPGCELTWCCDASEAARERYARTFPNARFTGELEDLLADAELDAVVLAPPAPSHPPPPPPAPPARTPRSPSACCAPASTASSRSRWRSRSPTPSGRLPRRRRAGGR